LKHITRTVWILSLVSLFTDTASEMLYPVMPIYLKSIGFSIVLIGILEGLAEATAGLSKGYFGKWSDNSGRRAPFVQVGYMLSSISRPMMAFFVFPLWIFFARTLDRFGKGIRTAARDAILSEETSIENKASVFGFHRSMDTLGAVLGPSLALLYLYFYPEDYITLFYIAFIPGFFSILASLLIKDKKTTIAKTKIRTSFFDFIKYWKSSPSQYKKLVLGLLLFALFNSSDIFLLLKAKQAGLSDTLVIGIFIFFNLVYALFAYPLGIIADRVGLKPMFIIGLVLFTAVYFIIGFATSIWAVAFVFFIYGIYFAATEGISKAWISNVVDKKDTATAIGTYASFQSICAMLASSIAGLIWFQFGATASFLLTGCISLFLVYYFIKLK
jgi:MFS family permease